MNIADLVVKHTGWIRRKARQFYADRCEADDLASETIYKCLCNANRYNPEMSFKPWALAIMSNIYITQYNRRRCVLFTGLDDHTHSENQTAPTNGRPLTGYWKWSRSVPGNLAA